MSDTTPCAHRQFFGAREFCPDCGLSRAEVLVEACAPFLKDDETPAECIARNRQDASGCLTMLIDERRKVESLRSRLAAVVGIVQRTLQPAGSPPLGDEEILVRWICDSTLARLAKVETALQRCADYLDTSATCNSDRAMASMARAALAADSATHRETVSHD